MNDTNLFIICWNCYSKFKRKYEIKIFCQFLKYSNIVYPTYTCKLNLWINESTGFHISRKILKNSNWINLQIHNLKLIIWYIWNFVRNLFSLDATLNTLFNCSFGNRSIWHRTQIHFHLRSFTPQSCCIKIFTYLIYIIWNKFKIYAMVQSDKTL